MSDKTHIGLRGGLSTLLTWRALAVAVAVTLYGIAAIVRLGMAIQSPPLRIHVHDGVAEIDVRTLSEYPTTVRAIDVSKNDGTVLWRIVAQGSDVQIGRFWLFSGKNDPRSIRTDRGSLTVVVPQDGSQFFLEPDMKYRIEIQGEHASSKAEFELGR